MPVNTPATQRNISCLAEQCANINNRNIRTLENSGTITDLCSKYNNEHVNNMGRIFNIAYRKHSSKYAQLSDV